MTPTVCVPYRPGDALRDASWAFSRARWERAGFRVVTGDRPGRFSPARARNQAALEAGGWKTALFADADMILADPAAQGLGALSLAWETGGLVSAFETLRYLDAAATALVLAGRLPTLSLAYWSVGRVWSGPFAIHRDLWDKVGGMDEAYLHYDGEDVGFIQDVTRDGPEKRRVRGDCFHLYHEPRGHIFRPDGETEETAA